MKKILVIRFSGLGDIIMLLQALKKLKSKYRNSHITLLTDCNHKDIKEISCGIIDEVFCVDRKLFKKNKIIFLKEIFKTIKFLRTNKFDKVFDLQNFGETALISYLSKAKEKIGAPKKSKYFYGYTIIKKRDEKGHRSQFFSRILDVDDSLNYSEICLPKETIEFKKKIKLEPTKKTIGINIGSTQESRRWSEKNFLQLSKKLKT